MSVFFIIVLIIIVLLLAQIRNALYIIAKNQKTTLEAQTIQSRALWKAVTNLSPSNR